MEEHYILVRRTFPLVYEGERGGKYLCCYSTINEAEEHAKKWLKTDADDVFIYKCVESISHGEPIVTRATEKEGFIEV